MELVDILSSKNLIKRKVTKNYLDKRLKEGIKKKVIPGEQWFRKPENWYSITAFANPYKTPYTELKILLENSKKLKHFLTKTLKIFYGIGIGDSETSIIQSDLEEERYSEVIAIDAIDRFIEGFIQSLRNLVHEYPNSRIIFKGLNALFEDLERKDLIPSNAKYKSTTHICLGNTIGNFDQEEIFEIFERNTSKDDFLLLGFQLNKNVKKMLSQYKKNPRFERLILSSVDDELKNKKLLWKWNPEESQIEAWLDDILAFRSKKYSISKFEEFVRERSLLVLKRFIEGDIAVYLLKKV